MMSHNRSSGMGFITFTLKFLFILVVSATSVGLLISGVVMYPGPNAVGFIGTGLFMLVFLAISGTITMQVLSR